MLQKLLENWLDSASERSYQEPFCQLLAAEGHRLIHSTRHTPIEFGKDVISRSATGTVCAFQLKGNPSGRLTLNQYREIKPQLIELTTLPINYPGVQDTEHKSFLVTNGEVDEDVQKELAETNQWLASISAPGGTIEIWSRGTLLDMVTRYAETIYLPEWGDIQALLEIYLADGRDTFPSEQFDRLLRKTLRLRPEDANVRRTELDRSISSSSLMTALALKNYSEERNHASELEAWAQCFVYSVGSITRWSVDEAKRTRQSLDLIQGAVFHSLTNLADDILSREHFIEGDLSVDFITYHWRATLLVSLMSLYFLWCEEVGWPRENLKNLVRAYINGQAQHIKIWGEGCIPQLFLYLWFLRNTDATVKTDLVLSTFCEALSKNQTNEEALPNPYYSFSDVQEYRFSTFLTHTPDPIGDDVFFKGSSFFVEPLFDCLVRSNMKQTCKRLWPHLTRVGWKRFIPGETWEYCVNRAASGAERMFQPPYTENWTDVVRRAQHIGAPEVPELLLQRPQMLMLYLVFFPHRATPNVLRYLDYLYGRVWFLGEPIQKGLGESGDPYVREKKA